jgi:hypothetical protein
MRKKLKLSSDGGDSANKESKRGYGGTYGRVWRSLRSAGVWSQAVGFVLARLAEIWLQKGFIHVNFDGSYGQLVLK